MATREFELSSQLTRAIHLLGVGLILLKASGNTDWPWWAVTAPFWLPLAIAALFFIIGLVMVTIYAVVTSYLESKNADSSVQEQARD